MSEHKANVMKYDLFGRTFDDFVREAHSIFTQAKQASRPVKTFALFSGGNDSTVMLHLMKPHIDAAVHINTGIGIPETREYVVDTCARWHVPLLELRTDPAVYRDIVLGPRRKGFPGPAFHYICYHRLKAQRLQDLQRDFSKRGETLLLVSGVRASESARRMRNLAREFEPPRGRLSRCWWVNPIVHFDHDLMSAYRRRLGVLSSPVSVKLHKSGDCLCGAFAAPGELNEIAFWYPDTADYIRALEKEALKNGKEYPYWGKTRPGKNTVIPGQLCSSCLLS